MKEPGITMLSASACAVVCGNLNTDVMMGTASTAPPTPKKPPSVPHRMPSTLARRGNSASTAAFSASIASKCRPAPKLEPAWAD